MIRQSIALIALSCFLSLANSTTLPRISIEELFDAADYVFVVEVSDVRSLQSSGNQCGAITTGEVIRELKGEAETILFGHYYGYAIGSTYLIFLTEPGREFSPITSTNSVSLASEREYRERCNSLHTAANVMHSGFGAMEITGSHPYGTEDAVKIAADYVLPPEMMPFRGNVSSFPDGLGGYAWVLASNLVEYLDDLQ